MVSGYHGRALNSASDSAGQNWREPYCLIRNGYSFLVEGFTQLYGIHNLVWYEPHESMESVIQREKQLKEWKRKWKMRLIESANPNWEDLYNTLV